MVRDSDNKLIDAIKLADLLLRDLDNCVHAQNIGPEIDNIELLKKFSNVFKLILKDSNEPTNIYNYLLNKAPADSVYSHVKQLAFLLEITNKLEDSFPYKAILLERLYDNINPQDIIDFNEESNSNLQVAAEHFVKNYFVDNLENTVEVRTWGTQNELGQGLNNVVSKQIKNDGVGHAALVIRFPANEGGQQLIKNYCLEASGKVKVPYEIKRYGSQVLYEVYWSYWPNRLHSQKQDIEFERQNLEYSQGSVLNKDFPQELKEQYSYEKIRNGKTIELAPPAQGILTSTLVSQKRRNYARLKRQKYKINEEISLLELLLDNYLEPSKSFSPNREFSKMAIRPDSNFLAIIKRFKLQLDCKTIIAQILINKHISTFQSSQIKESITRLLSSKKSLKQKLKDELNIASSLLDSSLFEQKKLKTKIKRRRSEIGTQKHAKGIKKVEELENKIQRLVDVLSFIKSHSHQQSFSVPEHILDPLQKLMTFKNTEYRAYITDILQTKKMKKGSVLNELVSEYESMLDCSKSLYDKQKAAINLNDDLDELRVLYHRPKRNEMDNLRILIDKYDNAINECQLTLDKVLSVLDKNLMTDETNAIDVICSFYFMDENNFLDKRQINITSRPEAESLREQLYLLRAKLIEKKKYYIELEMVEKIRSNSNKEMLKKKMINRGLPYGFSILHDFDIEKMLAMASKLAGTTKDFKLDIENCSTTSLKILQHGALEDKKKYFNWSQAKKGEKYASNTFLSNPQMVYSSAKVCEKIEQGGEGAQNYAKKIRKSMAARNNYFSFLNEIAAKEDKEFLSLNNKIKLFFKVIWHVISNPISIYHFVKDYFFFEKEEQSKPAPLLLSKIGSSIKALSNNDYIFIDSFSPILAIKKMIETLDNAYTNIPFFSKSTLKIINEMILELEAKESLDSGEQNILDSYYKVLDHRNKRIECVEEALTSGDNVKELLIEKGKEAESIKWDLTEGEMMFYRLNAFIKLYKKEKRAQFFSFFRPSALEMLLKPSTLALKLENIERYISKHQSSLSAKVWRYVAESEPCLGMKAVNNSSCINTLELPAFAREGKSEKQRSRNQDFAFFSTIKSAQNHDDNDNEETPLLDSELTAPKKK